MTEKLIEKYNDYLKRDYFNNFVLTSNSYEDKTLFCKVCPF